MKKDKLLLDRIKKDIKKAKVVSFDIFDTLLLRPYVKPTDLFLHMEKALNRPGFAEERKDAERRARIRHKELEDITFDMIYEEIDDEFKDLKQKEMDWEEMVLRANPELKQVYDYAKELGKKIVIASDMYLPTEFIAKILRKNGFDGWDKLYVSGNLGKSKGKRSLFRHMLNEIKHSGKQCLHIGDHKVSDKQIPDEEGLKTILYEKVLNLYLKKNIKAQILLEKYPSDLEVSVLIMILALHWQKNKKENFFTRIAYEYGGPMCYAYMRWVEQEVLKEGIETLLFIARDGYSLKKIFDNFEHSNIQTFYVYAPRKLAINCKNNEKDFLEYKKYIERLNIQGKNIAIVDTITENFSAQSLLIKTLADKNIKGFYWNIVSSKNSNDLNYKKKQWGERSNHSRILCWDFIEYMMTSPEAPILKIENLKVLHKKDITKEEIKRQKLYPKISNSIIQFQSDIKFFNSFSYSLIKEWTNLLFSNANKKEKNSISKIRCAYDSNHKNYRSMYSFPKINKGKKYLTILNIPLLKIKEKTFYSSKYKTMLIKKKIKIIGIPLLKVEKANWFYKIYFCRIKLLSYKKNNDKKKISFLGIPLIKITGFKLDQKAENLNIELKQFIKNNSSEMIKQINRLIEKKLSTFHLHQKTFLKFKGINRGKDVVIVATGPTLSKFKQIKEAIYIGVNRAYQFTDVHFNYYFIQDFSGETPNYIDDVYRYRNCIKFIGLTAEDSDPRKTIPEKYSLGNDIYRYRTDWENIENFKTKFSYDLSTTALGCGGTVVLPALQFALYTQPKRIYLVGVDTSNSGYFNSKTKNILFPELLKQRYIELKNFAEQYYPDIEIISINPVGLKGIFKDVYTETPSNEI